MPFGSINKLSAALALVLLAACGSSGPKRAPVIGEAFVGPAILKLRSDIPTQSAAVASVHHGERLEILRRRRTFFYVRTASGAEGWADERQLLAASDMAGLKQLAAVAAKLPSQGAATPRYGDLRIFTQPSLDSPSFVTVKEKDQVNVLTHALMPRAPRARTPLLPQTPKKEPPKRKPKSSNSLAIPLPKPPPPGDWLALSKTEPPPNEEADLAASPPLPTDDWSLVRTTDGQTGWTLTRRLNMAIPDEVAQYAEGHRIVSYFSLGAVSDGDTKKDIWLWTTVGDGPHAYDFDSLRVFIWSLRHHRYETAYIERNLMGFQPVLLEQVDFKPPGRAALTAAPEKLPGFSVCIQKKDGQRYRRVYALFTNVIRFAGERPCEAPPSVQNLIASASAGPVGTAESAVETPKESVLQRTKKRIRAWFGK